MDTVFKFLFEFLGQFFGAIWDMIVAVFTAIGKMFNIPQYVTIVKSYTSDLGGLAWVVALIAMIILVAVLALIVILVVLSVKRWGRYKKKVKDTNDLVAEVNSLNREVMRLNLEKDKILSMKVSQIGLNPNEIAELTEEEMQALQDGEEGEKKNRFFKLNHIDEVWSDYQPPVYDNEITLPEFADRFRNFACSRLHLYYDIKLIRLFVAAFGSTRLIILQGISGTGKTSLAYAFGKYVCNPSIITPVQPSWRDRTELFGYFNEFTKKFNESELLRAMYEATYNENIYLTVLDEMNIARVEYYFAEMLSILEMPDRNEWVISMVPDVWEDDPKHFENGNFTLPPNMWYLGTANNDDSTFAIADKVYDRAMPINIDTKGTPFEAPDTEPLVISYKHFEEILNKAKAEHPVSADTLEKLNKLDDYVIEHFRIAFGNRIVKQMKDFVPCYVGCGGTELEGLDYVLATKIFRKFESLNLAFIRDEIDGLVAFMDHLYGREEMLESKAYLRRLQKMV
ncbi:MAG: AAA family ATPase [Acutalibacteraceae bacterium]